jgi:Tfp pilus assembly protein PilF
MKKNVGILTIVALLFALSSVPMWSQMTQVEGTVTDAGKPVPNSGITLTNVGTNRPYKVKTDKNGKFSMIGVTIGDYEVEVISSSGEKLFKQKVSVAPSETSGVAELKIDISATKPGGAQTSEGQPSQTGQPSQPPEGTSGKPGQQPKYTKEQIEEMKKQNEKAKGLNDLIAKANTAMNNKNWQEAVDPLQQLVAAEPNNWQYYSALGDAQLNLKQYDQAVDAYQKGIEATESNTTVDPKNPSTDPAKKKAGEAKMLTSQGNAYISLHKNKEAVAAFTKAAALDPNPGTAYFNLCATQYNTGNVDGALEACDKAIAADPTKADAYFIKGSLLIGNSKTDKDGKIIAPPGAAEALNKYLQLAPSGAHAEDVKQMLQYIGSKVESSYKKGK